MARPKTGRTETIPAAFAMAAAPKYVFGTKHPRDRYQSTMGADRTP
jgi:hypothetical protein